MASDRSSKRVAIIDIGTQTSKIQIADVFEDRFETIKKLKFPTLVGKDGILKNEISSEAKIRLFHAMDQFKKLCLENDCQEIMAFATAMMRKANNGPEIVEEVFQRTGIAIQVIDGEIEAELIFKGVSSCVDPLIGQYLIMDIGGGSTEFIIVSGNEPKWKKSFSFGATSLMEKFKVSDPISLKEIDDIHAFFDIELKSLFENCLGVQIPLVSSSGSFDSISEMIHHRKSNFQNFNVNEGQTMILEDLISLHSSLISSTHNERKLMRGLVEFRRDTIVMAILLIEYLLNKLNISSIMRVPYSLKEGAIVQFYISDKVS